MTLFVINACFFILNLVCAERNWHYGNRKIAIFNATAAFFSLIAAITHFL